MRGKIRHRGPDDEGVWTSPDGRAGFAHTRLSILDLTAAGHQPMQSADGRFTITYNGEIYNFRELRRSLEQRGAEFRTRTDTEVILNGVRAGWRRLHHHAARHVRVCDLGRARSAAACSRAIGSASSRCTSTPPMGA